MQIYEMQPKQRNETMKSKTAVRQQISGLATEAANGMIKSPLKFDIDQLRSTAITVGNQAGFGRGETAEIWRDAYRATSNTRYILT